ncbi:unnamed protein product, partial [Rotaria magnacalcarata]
ILVPLGVSCRKIPPMPIPEASVVKTNGVDESGYSKNKGYVVKIRLNSSNECC